MLYYRQYSPERQCAAMMIPLNNPARFCEPEVFETLYKFNARLSLQVESTMYLCVLRAPDSQTAEALVQHLQTNLYHGEVICEKEPCVYYMQAFADREEEIIIRLDDARECVPGVVTQYMPIPKED